MTSTDNSSSQGAPLAKSFEPNGYRLFLSDWETQKQRYLEADAALGQPMAYAMSAGGKHVRPKLCLLAATAVDADWATSNCSSLVIGCARALEKIHTYSLIHDDLPCMDDDDLRRGRPTLHRQFDEATALLIGDALLTDAFAAVVAENVAGLTEAVRTLHCARLLAEAAGGHGMVLGQMLDMKNQGGALESGDVAALERIHSLKTGGLIAAACAMGAAAAGADSGVVESFKFAGGKLGLAFQIADDLLDANENTGKTGGKDAVTGKHTYLDIFGKNRGMTLVHDLTGAALGALNQCGRLSKEFEQFAWALSRREF